MDGVPRLDWTPEPRDAPALGPGREVSHRGGSWPAAAWAPGVHRATQPGRQRFQARLVFRYTAPVHTCFIKQMYPKWVHAVPLPTVPGDGASAPLVREASPVAGWPWGRGPGCGSSHPDLLGQSKARVPSLLEPPPDPCWSPHPDEGLGRAAGPQAALPPQHRALYASFPAGVALGVRNQGPPTHTHTPQAPAAASRAEPRALLSFRLADRARERTWLGEAVLVWASPPFPHLPTSLPSPRGGRRAKPTPGCPSLRASGRLSQPQHGDRSSGQEDVLGSACAGLRTDRTEVGLPGPAPRGRTEEPLSRETPSLKARLSLAHFGGLHGGNPCSMWPMPPQAALWPSTACQSREAGREPRCGCESPLPGPWFLSKPSALSVEGAGCWLRWGEASLPRGLGLFPRRHAGPERALPVLCPLSPLPLPQGPARTLLLEDEHCWLQSLPQALTEAEANTEIYRKGWYRGASLAAFRQVGVTQPALAGP